MIKKFATLITLMFALAVSVFAGDVARYVNLGFSSDSSYYMFGFYGMDSEVNKPYAELFIVDTKKNNFVKNGIYKGMYATDLNPGWDAAGCFYKLFATAVPDAKKMKIDHMEQGRLVYLTVDGELPSNTITFKDYDTDKSWNVVMNKSITGEKEKTVSSFSLDITITDKDGKVKTIKAGNPTIKRNAVLDYSLDQIIIAPNEKYAVAIISRIENSKDGKCIRYMVETFTIL